MNNGTARRFTDGATKDLMRNWSRVSLAQEEELEKVGDRVSLVPVKIGVRDLAGFLQKRSKCIGDHGTGSAQHTMLTDALTGYEHVLFEVGGIATCDFEEEDTLARAERMLVARLVVRIVERFFCRLLRTPSDHPDHSILIVL